MKSFRQRLEELKKELESSLQSRMNFLLNPKDTKILEAIVAWTVIPKQDIDLIQVDDQASLNDLWKVIEPDILAFSVALGCSMIQALPRFEQLKALEIIYPDGSVADLANSITNVYIKNQVDNLKNLKK